MDVVVSNPGDSGPGTFRQALLDAVPGDRITFDPGVFPPQEPAIIYVLEGLPPLVQGHLTIDASQAGVIMDGSLAQGEWVPGLEIDSEWNVVRGLTILHFSGAGFVLNPQARYNVIGGDRQIGSGPVGQGNRCSDNSDGIGLNGARKNTISGNLIGTDSTGNDPLGNRVVGIFLDEGAKGNVIGPDNVVAFNGEAGVEVRSQQSTGNKITQNSIHDNSMAGIVLPQNAGFNPGPPIFFDFDLKVGTLTGSACANCQVEIFSDDGSDGQFYDGGATCDSDGWFSIDLPGPFTGPHLTATTTDVAGTTSQFSTPTTEERRFLVLQKGNVLPKKRIQIFPSAELLDNRIGSQWNGFWLFPIDEIIDTEILDFGLKRVRLAVNGISWDTVDWSKPEFTINPAHDRLFTRIADNGVTITYVLTFWDKEAAGEGGKCPRFETEEEIQRYLDFVRFIVSHFKDRVQYFEVWNEPDIGVCEQHIDVDDYINLIRRVVPVIREEYPQARIKVGSTMHLGEAESHDYFFQLLRSDVMPLVDAIAWHVGVGMSPDHDYWREYYAAYPALVQEIKNTAESHGFAGEYIADELTWWTPEDVPDIEVYMGTYDDKVAAKYYARGVVRHLGMDITVGVGGASQERQASFSTLRNLCTIMSGVEPISIPLKIESQAADIESYAFALPDGDYLVAVWQDVAAVDECPGVQASIVIPAQASTDVVGIDVLESFEQPMKTIAEGDRLVVCNLLVRDYPLILHVTPVSGGQE